MKITRVAGAMALALAALLTSSTASGQADSFPDSNASSPSRHGAAITPSDTTDLTRLPKAIYVGGGGDVAMIGVDAPSGAPGITFKAVPAGSIIPFRPRRILATGTTATLMLALY